MVAAENSRVPHREKEVLSKVNREMLPKRYSVVGSTLKQNGLIVLLLLSLTPLLTTTSSESTQPSDPILLANCGMKAASLVANVSQVVAGSSGTIMFSCGAAGAALTATGPGSVTPQFSLPSSYSSLAISASSACASTVTLTSGSPVEFGTGSGMLPVTSYNYCAAFANAPSTGLVSFTITWSAPSLLVVGCGHDLSCSVQSNATLSNIRFAGVTVHVEAVGPSGAHGYANVTVPKAAIPNIDNVHVFVDNSKLSSSAVVISSNSTDYFIYFTFTFHSPVVIDIQLTTPENAPNLILGLDPRIFYGIVSAIAVVLVVGASVAYRSSKHRSRTGKIPHQ